jgi:hypothetical protein
MGTKQKRYVNEAASLIVLLTSVDGKIYLCLVVHILFEDLS